MSEGCGVLLTKAEEHQDDPNRGEGTGGRLPKAEARGTAEECALAMLGERTTDTDEI